MPQSSWPARPSRPESEHFTAISQNSRVRFVVLHNTSAGDALSMKLLPQGRVSAHYPIDTPDRAYRRVDETRAAWHAGESAWYGLNAMNSIGIEIVNPGWTDGNDGQPNAETAAIML